MANSRRQLLRHVFGTLCVVALVTLLGGVFLRQAPVYARGHADCGTIADPNPELSNELDPSGNPTRCAQARLDRRTLSTLMMLTSGLVLVVSVGGWLATRQDSRQASELQSEAGQREG